jgi:DNA sulfur modification protein DndD
MKVVQVVIKNFMPFYEEVPINLHTRMYNPFILFGVKNDRGKTAIFTALKFCLYGFEGNPPEKSTKRRQVINRQAAVDGFEETSVTIEFTHNDTVYEIERVITFDQADNPDDRDYNDCYVTVRKPGVSEGKKTVIDRGDRNKKYNEFINGILPKSASDFFFFDGEELDRYAGSYENNGEDVREAIETVLGIREIHNAIDDLENNGRKHYRKKWQEKVGDVKELEELSEEMDRVEGELTAKKTEKDSAERDLEQKQERLEQIEDELADAKGLAESRERIKEIEKEIEGTDEEDGLADELGEKRNAQRSLHSRIGPLMIALGADTMVDAYDVSIVSGLEGVLEHLLDAETCICGTPIEEDERETLERNLAKIQNDEMKTVAALLD